MKIGTLALVLLYCGGCLAFDPGGATARGLKQENTFGWTNEAFNANTLGSHEGAFTMYEGYLVFATNDDGSLMVDDDVNPVIDPIRSNVTAYLNLTPKTDVAGSAVGIAFAESTKQAENLTKTLLGIAAMAIPAGGVGGGSSGDGAPGIQAGGTIPVTVSVADLLNASDPMVAAAVEDLLRAFEAASGSTTAPPG